MYIILYLIVFDYLIRQVYSYSWTKFVGKWCNILINAPCYMKSLNFSVMHRMSYCCNYRNEGRYYFDIYFFMYFSVYNINLHTSYNYNVHCIFLCPNLIIKLSLGYRKYKRDDHACKQYSAYEIQWIARILRSNWNWLRVFENRVLRQIFVPKMDENVECRRLNSEEFHSLYRSPSKVKVIKCRWLRWGGHVAIVKKGRNSSKILTCKP